MRQTQLLVLLSTVAPFPLAAASASIRGVGPEFVKFYESKKAFACIANPEIKLRVDQLNDNSCDCPDGSDEPGTAACAYIDALSPLQPLPGSLSGTTNTTNALPGFWCANVGHIGAYVPFAYVNDGVCDYDVCCDGSEEYSGIGGIKCENRCVEIGKEWKRLEEERKQSIERASKKRQVMIKEAHQIRKNVESRIKSLKEEISALEVKKGELEKKYKQVEEEDRGKIVKTEVTPGKLGILIGLAKNRVRELRDMLDEVMDQRDDYKDRLEELEEILKKFKEEYNPNFNDEGVKRAVKSWEEYAENYEIERSWNFKEADFIEALKEDGPDSGINWTEYEEEEEESDTDILLVLEAYLPDFIQSFVHDKLNAVRIWMIENGILADNPKSGQETKRVIAAREAFQAVSSDVAAKNRELNEKETDLNKDYGPDEIFRALKDKCTKFESGEYEYELCWMGATTQKSKTGHGSTNMGHFKEMVSEMVDEEMPADAKGLGSGIRMVMKYENGLGCWNGPNRRTDVWLACSETEEIWRVIEAEKCVYRMEVGTPVACNEAVEPPKGKDEL